MRWRMALILGTGVWATSTEALAEPWFAQRTGYRCSKCHVNGTGGGLRSAFGRQWAWSELSAFGRDPAQPLREQSEGDTPQKIWKAIDPALNDYITVGANLRAAYRATLLDDEVNNTFAQPEANAYLALSAIDYLTAYLDVGVAEGSVEAREAFIMLHRVGGFRLRAGIILLPYGLRIWDNEAFIRRETGFTYADSDLGLELGLEHGGFGVFAAISNGTGGSLDTDNDKRLSGTIEYAHRIFRVGASGAYNRSSRQEDLFAGAHAGLSLGRLTLLAEGDLLTSNFLEQDETLEGFVFYGEANFLIYRGISLKGVYELHDPVLDIDDNERIRVRGGLETFLIPMVSLTAFYDFRESVPQDEVGNADVVSVELHLYL